jgi:hypothetical protein
MVSLFFSFIVSFSGGSVSVIGPYSNIMFKNHLSTQSGGF